jgi:hypothetical protein
MFKREGVVRVLMGDGMEREENGRGWLKDLLQRTALSPTPK